MGNWFGAKSHGAIVQDFFALNLYGFQESVGNKIPPAVLNDFLTALVNIAGADGEFSAEERTFLRGYLCMGGLSSFFADKLVSSVQGSVPIETTAQKVLKLREAHPLVKKYFKLIILTCVQVANADGLAAEELEAIHKFARIVGVPADVVEKMAAIEREGDEIIIKRLEVLGFADDEIVAPKFKDLIAAKKAQAQTKA